MYQLYRLGFDIDEVMSTTSDVLVNYAKKEYGVDFDKKNYGHRELFISHPYIPGDPDKSKSIGLKLMEDINNPHIQNTAIPIKDSPKTILKWKNLNHKIYFVSSRMIGEEEHTKKWLNNYGIPFDGVYHLGHNISKGIFCKDLKLDFFLEDIVSHLIELFEVKNNWRKGLLLFNRPWNIEADLTHFPISRCHTWEDVDSHLTSYGDY